MSAVRRLAAVSVGSNTVHVLVADALPLSQGEGVRAGGGEAGRLTEVMHAAEMPELGAAVDRTGRIGPEKAAEAVAALETVLAAASEHGHEHLVAGATAAVRAAADQQEFLARMSAAAGVPVRLIDEHREAELSFRGVASAQGGRRAWLMADMGGASTELVAADGDRLVAAVSLRLGSGTLTARHMSDPPLDGEREELRAAAMAELRRAPEWEAEKLVLTGGTASNLPLVLSPSRPPPILTTRALLTAAERLDAGPAAALAPRLGLPEARVRALRGGVELLLLLLDFYGLDRVHVSHAGLRHGMLLAWLERGEEWWR